MSTIPDVINLNHSLPVGGSINDKFINLFSKLYSGSGTPGAGVGTDGSFYFDILNAEIYGKQSGAWSLGTGGGGESSIPVTLVPTPGTTETLDGGNATTSVFLITLDSSSLALTYTGFKTNEFSEMIIFVNTGSSRTITHATAPTWDGGGFSPVIPTTSGVIAYSVYSLDGSTLRGAHNQRVRTIAIGQDGTVAAGSRLKRFYATKDGKIVSERCSAGTAPTGQSMIFDWNKNGTTMYSTQGNRPTIAASANTGSTTLPDITSYVAGDYFTFDLDQVGSTVAGGDITLQFEVLEAY